MPATAHIKKGIRNGVTLPTMSYTRDMDVEHSNHKQAVDRSCQLGACNVSRWDTECNEDMYRRFGMSEVARLIPNT